MTNVPDTTNASGGSCGTSTNGPTWATDQFPSVTLSAQSTGSDTWNVTITSDGSFVAFADPTNCDALLSEGNIAGMIQYTVTSPNTPSQSGLLSDYAGATEFSTLIDGFFGGSPTIGGGNIYDYSYQNGNYVQDATANGLTVTGDVQPVACTVTVTSPGNQTSAVNKAITGLQIAATSNYPGTLVFDTAQKDVNLPTGLSISATGQVTGTPTKTGTTKVAIAAGNPNHLTPACVGTATFNWTVSATAPSSSPGNVPTGGVETGGGKPAGDPFLPFGIILAALAVAAVGTAGGIALRRQHQGR